MISLDSNVAMAPPMRKTLSAKVLFVQQSRWIWIFVEAWLFSKVLLTILTLPAIPNVHCSSHFSIVQKFTFSDIDVTVVSKNRTTNSNWNICIYFVAGTNFIGEKRAVYDCKISVSNVNCSSTVILALKSGILYCESLYWWKFITATSNKSQPIDPNFICTINKKNVLVGGSWQWYEYLHSWNWY